MRRYDHARVLMYSHDTFGLGHLRRCREIAHALVERFKRLQVLIVSGSSIAGAFDFRARVDFIKMDIEGAEQKALAGAAGSLRAYRPRIVFVDADNKAIDLGHDPAFVPFDISAAAELLDPRMGAR